MRWLVAGCLVAAAVIACWPGRGRRRWVMDSRRPATRRFHRPWTFVKSLSAGPVLLVAVAGAGLVGTVLAGPVAGLVTGAYGGLATRGALRRRASRAAAQMHTRSLDALCALAADLRAGLPPGALDGPESIEDRRIAELTRAAWRLAERTGAPIAELVERIEADARAMDRGSAAAAAQAAGARATAWLLAGLPVGGIALGYVIGVDPLDVLLHTPIGAGCAIGAIALQIAGLAWADRLGAAGVTKADRLVSGGATKADRFVAGGVNKADRFVAGGVKADRFVAAGVKADRFAAGGVTKTDRSAVGGAAKTKRLAAGRVAEADRLVAGGATDRFVTASSADRRVDFRSTELERASGAESGGGTAAGMARAVGRTAPGAPNPRRAV